MANPSHHRRPADPGPWIFVCLLAVYLLSYSGSFHSIDEVSTAAMTESLAKHGQVTTDQVAWSQSWLPTQGRLGPDGHIYSKKGVGTALLGAPLYWLAVRLPALGASRALMLANALVTALTGWLVYDCVRRLGYRTAIAAVTALSYGLGTMAWPYAKYFYSEPLTALGLTLGLWGLLATRQTGRVRTAALAGMGLGLALLAKVSNGATWPFFLAYAAWLAWERRKREAATGRWLAEFALAFLFPLLLAGFALAAYNVVRTGNLLDLGYTPDEAFSTPLWRGLLGLLLSPGKSLFVYSPLLIAALFGIPTLLRRDRATAALSLAVTAFFPLLYARWFMWWGGWSWGPRFLLPSLPFLCLFLAPVVDRVLGSRRRWLRWGLAAWAVLGVCIQVLGVGVDFNRYLLDLYQQGIGSEQVNFRVELSPLRGHWALLLAGETDLAWVRDGGAGIDWPRLAWPLALLAGAAAGWGVAGRLGRRARRVVAAAVAGLLLVSMGAVLRLDPPADDWQAGSQALSETLQKVARPGDVLIVDLRPYSDHLGLATMLLDRYKAAPAYWGWARQEPVSGERQALLAALGQRYQRAWLALESTPEADPASTTEHWLDDHAYRVSSQWLSPAMRLVEYQLSAEPLGETPDVRLDLRLGQDLELLGFTAGPAEVCAGDNLAVSLFWQAQRRPAQDYVVTLQLLDDSGRLRAQVDRPPVGGFRPTSSWTPGEVIRDNYGMALPSDLPPGRYHLIAGLYLPASLERLPVSSSDGLEMGGSVALGDVTAAGGGCQ